jgi:hypothetical protein
MEQQGQSVCGVGGFGWVGGYVRVRLGRSVYWGIPWCSGREYASGLQRILNN